MEPTKYDIIGSSDGEAYSGLRSYLSLAKKGNKGGSSSINNQGDGSKYLLTENDEDVNIMGFFKRVEKCRRDGVILHFCEIQYVKFEGCDISKSCLELDFDIKQSNSVRVSDEMYGQIVYAIISELNYIFVMDASVEYYIAIMRKPEIQMIKKGEYKESFHIRIFIRMTKETKKFILNKWSSENKFHMIKSVDFLDKNSATYPVMLLGSMKKSGKKAHELYRLVKVDMKYGYPNPVYLSSSDYETHNLCYETSIVYEQPIDPLIRKPDLALRETVAEMIKMTPINIGDDDIGGRIHELKMDHTADYYRRLLRIIPDEKFNNYADWRTIIFAMANVNRDYMPLVVEASMRIPDKWNANGMAELCKLWDHAIANKNDNPITEATLVHWAREANIEEFTKLGNYSVLRNIFAKASNYGGKLNDTDIATLLKIVYGKMIFSDIDPVSLTRRYSWFEFNLRVDGIECDVHNSCFKWVERPYPLTLDKYISSDKGGIKDYFNEYMTHVDNIISEESEDSSNKQYFVKIKKNIKQEMFKLGQQSKIQTIISRCSTVFCKQNLMRKIDTNPNFIGVLNGVVQLRPNIMFIQNQMEDVLIKRCANANFMPWNDDMEVMERKLKKLFVGEDDAFELIMCYLAEGLDRHKKTPYLFVMGGEGQNGKSSLFELDLHTKNLVTNNGYATKLNAAFFTKERHTQGPDSEMMLLKYASTAMATEFPPGSVLVMDRIKEITSDTITSNEKHKAQETFTPNCRILIAGNNDPMMPTMDWGSIRRVVKYLFKAICKKGAEPGNKYEIEEDPEVAGYYTSLRYRSAYFGILLKHYDILWKKYNGVINYREDSPSIKRDTEQYIQDQDTIVKYVCLMYRRTDNKDDVVLLATMAQKYKMWFADNIDGKAKQTIRDIETAFERSSLRKFISIINKKKYLVGYVLKPMIQDELIDDIDSDDSKEPIDNINE
jgi:hypothetical protein